MHGAGLCSSDHLLAELREDLSWSRRLRMIVGDEAGRAKLAQGIAECLHKTGACVVQDPRVQPSSGVLCWDAPRAVQACCVQRQTHSRAPIAEAYLICNDAMLWCAATSLVSST